MSDTQDTTGTGPEQDAVERDIATLNQVLDAFMQKVERIQHDLRIDPDARDSTTLYKLYKHIVTLEDRIAALSALPSAPVAVTEAAVEAAGDAYDAVYAHERRLSWSDVAHDKAMRAALEAALPTIDAAIRNAVAAAKGEQ